MAGYVDTQVAAYRKVVGEAVAGKGLRDGIRQLQEKSKVRDTLKDLPARGAITAKRQIGKRTGADSNLTGYAETGRTFHTTLRELRSSDALFVLQYQNVHVLTMQDNGGRAVTFTYLDYAP